MDCPVCRAAGSAVLYHPRVWSRPAARVYRCGACASYFIDPPMTAAEEQAFYADFNQHYKARGLTPETGPAATHAKNAPVVKARWEKVADLFTGVERCLEIGSLTGGFIALVPAAYRAVVEPSAGNREFSRQFVQAAYADLADVPAGEKFDSICLFHVFEHIRDADPFLKRCRELLAPGGKVLIEVPCASDPLLEIYALPAYQDFYFQPMHPYVYSRRALELVFARNGYTPGEARPWQRFGLDNHLAWLTRGKPGGDPQLRELFGGVAEYARLLESRGITDTIFYRAGVAS